MKAKFLKTLLITLAGILCLAGCTSNPSGGGGSGDGDGDGGGGGSGQDAGKITIAVVGDQSERDVIKAFIRGYNKIPGNENKKITATYMEDYDAYIEKTLRNKRGVLPDIIQVFDITSGYYTNADLDGRGNSLLIPLTSFMEKDGIDKTEIVDECVKITQSKNNSDDMYWVPRDYNKIVVAYNKEMFKIAGITKRPSDDWTWSQFRQVCQQLKDHEEEIKVYSKKDTFFPVDMNLNFQAVYYPVLESFGIKLIDSNTKECFGGDIEGAKSAWGKLLNMVVEGLASPADSKIPFANKQSAMMFITRPDLPNYVNGVGEDNIDFISLPKLEGLPSGSKSYIGMGLTGYGITTHCPKERQEAAWDFLKYIISVDGQNVFSETGSCIPCLKSMLTDENAIFRQYVSKNLNHDAFVAYPERDLFAGTFLKGLGAEEQRNVYNVIHDNALQNFFYNGEIDEGFFEEFKQMVEDELD